MITEELGCELFEASQITSEKLLEYETIIYGGGQRRSLKCEELTWAFLRTTTAHVIATRENLYILFEPGDWEAVLKLFSSYLKNYLDLGKYSELLKSYNGVGIGFVGCDLNIVYKK